MSTYLVSWQCLLTRRTQTRRAPWWTSWTSWTGLSSSRQYCLARPEKKNFDGKKKAPNLILTPTHKRKDLCDWILKPTWLKKSSSVAVGLVWFELSHDGADKWSADSAADEAETKFEKRSSSTKSNEIKVRLTKWSTCLKWIKQGVS